MPWLLEGHHSRLMTSKLPIQRLRTVTTHTLRMPMSPNMRNLSFQKCYNVIQDIELQLKSC